MSFLGDRTRGVPEGGIFITKIKHIKYTAFEIWAHLNDISPSCPHGGLVVFIAFQYVFKGCHIFAVELFVQHLIHISGLSRSLRVYVEHYKAVVAIGVRNTLHGFQCIVKLIRTCGGGIYSDANEGIISPRTENISEFIVLIRHKKPF